MSNYQGFQANAPQTFQQNRQAVPQQRPLSQHQQQPPQPQAQPQQIAAQTPSVPADDPGSKVPLFLLNHLHLVVTWQLPARQQLRPDEIVGYLHRAPTILKDKQNAKCTVAWTMLHRPRDGITFLAYQPKKLGLAFASDGRIWTGPEITKTYDYKGFKVEALVQEAGYWPSIETKTMHQRTRYRLVAKMSTIPGEINPSIELVHYGPSKLEHQIPVDSINVPAAVRKTYVQQQWLASQGSLPKKEFMLDDKANWPTIEMPKRQRLPRLYNARSQSAQQQRTQNVLQQAANTEVAKASKGSPQKRARQDGMMELKQRAEKRMEREIRNEDIPQYGDDLDSLTPAEISASRYGQHMKWMEEITNSPHSVLGIHPVNLTLRPLEESLGRIIERSEKELRALEGKQSGFGGQSTNNAKSPTPTTRLAPTLRPTRREKRQKMLADLERQLAQTSPDQSLEDEQIQNIISRFELATRTKITPREDAVQVRKGGLLSGEEESSAQQQDEFTDFTNFDTAGEALDMYETADYQA